MEDKKILQIVKQKLITAIEDGDVLDIIWGTAFLLLIIILALLALGLVIGLFKFIATGF